MKYEITINGQSHSTYESFKDAVMAYRGLKRTCNVRDTLRLIGVKGEVIYLWTKMK